MKETWESCESLTMEVGNLEVFMTKKKREGLYDKFWKHLTIMCARWVRKSALGEPQLLHKMITGTFTMPSEECVSSVAGQIFCRGENSSQREGLPTRSMDTDLWAQDLNVPSLQTLILHLLCYCLLHHCWDLDILCLISSTGISNSVVSPQGTTLFVFVSSAICFSSRLFLGDSCDKKQKTKTCSGDLVMFCASEVGLSPHTEHFTDSQETLNTTSSHHISD